MKRCETRIDDGTLYVEDGDGWLEIGSMADLFDAVGGERYTIQYDDDASEYGSAWLDTDDENRMTIDVAETIAEMSYPQSFVEKLRDRPLAAGGGSVPERIAYFADVMTDVWDSKGTLSNRDDNPFQ